MTVACSLDMRKGPAMMSSRVIVAAIGMATLVGCGTVTPIGTDGSAGHGGSGGSGGTGGTGGGAGGGGGHAGAGGTTGTGGGGGAGGATLDGGQDAGGGDAGVRGFCNTAADCVFRANDGCCGSCLNPNDTPMRPPVCTVTCAIPPGGCSCVNHMCTNGILHQGDACDLQQDACGNGLKCCRNCGTPNCTTQPVCTADALTNGVPGCPAIP
jgi:hypothetical protein